MLHLQRNLSRNLVRRIATSSGKSKDISHVPLSTPLELNQTEAKIVPSKVAANFVKNFDGILTQTDSGLRVISEPHYGDFCTLGVAIATGCRYEANYPHGVSHLIEKLAFGGSNVHSSRDEIHAVIEKYCGMIDCQSTRDTFLFAASCHIDGVDDLMQIIANAIWRPRITDEELEEAQMRTEFENEDMEDLIDCTPLTTDFIHKAAFRDNTLGFSKFTPSENIHAITKEHVFSFMSQYHTPDRIVVGGVGVDQGTLMKAVHKYFDYSTAAWNVDKGLLLNKLPPIDNSIAQYAPGQIRVEKDLSGLSVGRPYPNLAHVVIGFEGVGYKDPDFIPFCVLQSLFGGGGSFSAGGPGKGMYTRLYIDVLNKHHWIYNATATNYSYDDAGLFTVYGSTDPAQVNHLLVVLTEQFLVLNKGVAKDELKRAKTQLKSQLMMNLEMRPVQFEDAVRQVMGYGYRRKPEEYMSMIDAVTEADIVRIADRMLAGRPCLAGYGEISKLADYDQLDDAVAKRKLDSLTAKTSFFKFKV
ncbi:hypothetical protein WR25_15440 [Diploscapter pachys]|uniref:Alpha-MPP n=1 Tax=Diploscapter pachys TaxID=2018661 RepID=A0A2A2JFP2_9BILA|nr:hypothetical protein WR25_15440 [Diploscapter pachys]